MRCRYCGTSHRVLERAPRGDAESIASATPQPAVEAERRLVGIVGPYLVAAAVGFCGYLLLHDFWWSPYGGWPGMVVAGLGLVVAMSGRRIPAAALLLVTGLVMAAKPWVRPIPTGGDGGYFSPTSETAFYYLVPGLISIVLGVALAMAIRVSELRHALRALLPRVTVAAVFALAGAGAYFTVHPTTYDRLSGHRAEIERLRALAVAACDGKLPEELGRDLRPAPALTGEGEGNAAVASCGELGGGDDPLYLDDDLSELFELASGHARRWHHRSARGRHNPFTLLGRLRYMVVYAQADGEYSARLIDLESKTVARSVDARGDDWLAAREALLSALAAASGGRFEAP